MNLDVLLNSLLKEGTNQAELIAIDKFERHMKLSDMSVVDDLVEGETMIAKLKSDNVSLPEPWPIEY